MGPLVHKTNYAPMIYTALCVMFLMQAASITWASGRGLGPGNQKHYALDLKHKSKVHR